MQKDLDLLDHFLSRNMLYHIYQNPTSSCEKLTWLMQSSSVGLFQQEYFGNMEKLASIISILLSKSYVQRTPVHKQVKTAINTCIENHIDRIYRGKSDSLITHLSFVQNMIAIFSLIPDLPKSYDLSLIHI